MTSSSPTMPPGPGEPTLPSVMGKVTRRLAPVLLLMFTMAFVDRVNIGFAKEALQTDTGLSDAAYALGAGIFFVVYAVFEVPSNLLLHRVGAKFWLTRIMITWGLVSAAMMFAQTEWAFYGLRVLLGIAEAGLFPGVILYITFWTVAEYRSRLNGLFMFGIPLSYIIGGPISGSLLDLHGAGGLAGWQWMFLIEGLASVVAGIGIWFYLDSKPQDARWLSVPEKKVLLAALAADEKTRAGAVPGHETWWKSLLSFRLWYIAAIFFTVQINMYGFTFFLPSQIADITGQQVGLAVGLLSVIPWVAAVVITRVMTKISDRTGHRRNVAMFSLAMGGVGIAGSVTAGQPVFAMLFLCLAAGGLLSVQPVLWTMPASILTGAAAASGIGLINSLGNLGGFVAPNLRVWIEGEFGPDAGMYAIAGFAFLGVLLLGLIGLLGVRTREARTALEPAAGADRDPEAPVLS